MKKLCIIVLLIFCFITSINIVNAKEYSGFEDSYYINDIYYSRYKDNIIRYQKATKLTKTIDLKNIYCLEPWLYLGLDNLYNVYENDYANNLNIDSKLWDKLSLISYYGYGYENHNEEKWIAITQILLWQYSDQTVQSYFTNGLNGPKIVKYQNEIDEIMNLVNNHYVKPSFDNSKGTINLNSTLKLIDTNNVLDKYEINETGGLDVTKKDNNLFIKGTRPGKYIIKLVKKDKLYNHNPIIYVNNEYQNALEVGSFEPIYIQINVEVTGGYITIDKKDSETKTNDSISDGILTGAKYGIYLNGNLVDTVITENGIAKSKVLPYGNYIIKEIEPSLGYELDNNIYQIKLNFESKILTVYENIKKYNLNIHKGYTINKGEIISPEENIVFQIYYKDKLYKELKTDSNGDISVNLPYGEYKIHQVNNFVNYAINKDFIVKITNEDVNKIITNNITKSKIKINKKDIETNDYILDSNSEFKITNINNNEEQILQISNGFLYTDYLNVGKYKIEEVDKYMDGYLYNDQIVNINITEDSLLKKDDNGYYIDIDFYNTKVKGEVNITKIGENNIDNLNYEEILLDNVYFELRSNSDTYRYKKDELISTLVTENGKINVKNLELGDYYLVEISSSNDNEINSEPYYFSLEYIDQYTPIITKDIILNNYIPKYNLIINKVDKDSNMGLNNVKFELYQDDNLIKELITDENGRIEIDNLKYGDYYLKEIETLPEYKLLEENISFNMNRNLELTILNEFIGGIGNVINEELPKHEIIEKPVIEKTVELLDTKNEVESVLSKKETKPIQVNKKEEIVIKKPVIEKVIETIEVPDTYAFDYSLIILILIYVKIKKY